MAFDAECKETQAALAKAVKDAVEEAVDGLKTKNSELLTKLKKAQKNSEIDPAEHAALQDELEQSQSDLAAAQKDLKKVSAEAEKHKASSETTSKTVYDLLVNNGLNEALLANGVKNPAYQKAAKALLSKNEFTFEGEGADRVAKVGDKTLSDFVKEWSGGDEGKAFVDAPGNGGGGAGGGAGENLDADAISKIADPGARLQAINAQEGSQE